MNKIRVQKLNECFGVDGPIWIEFSPEDYTPMVRCNPLTAFKKGHQTNKGRPTSQLQKQRARESALERYKNGYDVSGGNNPRAKTWRIVFMDGREIIIKALQRWAIDNGYSTSGIKNIAYGKWKTYRDIVSVEELAQPPDQTT